MTTTTKAVIGDSVQSSEFWLFPATLGFIADGGLDPIGQASVAVIYAAFVWGRVTLKVKGLAEVVEAAKKTAAVLLMGLCVLGLPGCGTVYRWLDQPASEQVGIVVKDAEGNLYTLDTETAPTGPIEIEVPGVGKVTVTAVAMPAQTRGDQLANLAGSGAGIGTGFSMVGLTVTKILGALIGSRRVVGK